MDNEKQDDALFPIDVHKASDGLMRLSVGSAATSYEWHWDAARLRAASKALAALADQLDGPLRTAVPGGGTYTKDNVLRDAKALQWQICAVIEEHGRCSVSTPWGVHIGHTWWEAAAKAGLFGTAFANRFRDYIAERTQAPCTTIALLCRDCLSASSVDITDRTDPPGTCHSCLSPNTRYLVPEDSHRRQVRRHVKPPRD